jgi:BirA family biotin operon repressor/biotin-[acetyl-CoA-carboxylase] ligase
MKTAPAATRSVSPVQADGPTVYWWVNIVDEADSTQRVAADLPSWSAVLALRQTGGRGQHQRAFVSDPGGFYLTAVLPFDGDAAGWRGFALAIGRAVMGALTEMGIRDLRLRWPNDLMIGSRKVGGILVEQGKQDTLLVGVGLNVANRPWLADPALNDTAGRFADHCPPSLGEPRELLDPVLRAIRQAHEEFSATRLPGLVPGLNRCWGARHEVRLEPVPGVNLEATTGVFAGIDERGRVLLAQPDGTTCGVPEHFIKRLVEVR